MSEIISVYYRDERGGQRDDYPDAVSWKIHDGNLRVVAMGDKGIAAYPLHQWSKVVKRTVEPADGAA